MEYGETCIPERMAGLCKNPYSYRCEALHGSVRGYPYQKSTNSINWNLSKIKKIGSLILEFGGWILQAKIYVFWPRSKDIGLRFHPFPIKFLVRSEPPKWAHFLSNFQNFLSLQFVKFIYGKWLILITITWSIWIFRDIKKNKSGAFFSDKLYVHKIRASVSSKLGFRPGMPIWVFLAPRFEALRVNILGWNLAHVLVRSKTRPIFFLWSSVPLEQRSTLPHFERIRKIVIIVTIRYDHVYFLYDTNTIIIVEWNDTSTNIRYSILILILIFAIDREF